MKEESKKKIIETTKEIGKKTVKLVAVAILEVLTSRVKKK